MRCVVTSVIVTLLCLWMGQSCTEYLADDAVIGGPSCNDGRCGRIR